LGKKEGFAAAHSHLERGGAAGRSEAVGFLVQLRSHLLGYLATIARLRFAAAEVGKKRKRAKKRNEESQEAPTAGPVTGHKEVMGQSVLASFGLLAVRHSLAISFFL